MSDAFLEKPIDYLKGVGPNRAQLLRGELGIHTYKDMLCVFPNRYIDRTRFYKIGELAQSQADVQIIGQITHIETINTGKHKRLVATFEDATGQIELVWFRGVKWIQKNLKTHTDYVAFGRLNWFGKKCSIAHPELDLEIDSKKQGVFQPIYPSTEKLASRGISNRIIRQIISNLFDEVNSRFSETLSEELMNYHNLIDRSKALRAIHFPSHQNELAQAQYRLKFEELFFIQLQILRRKQHLKNKFKGLVFDKVGSYFNEFYQQHLPFDLTNAQKRVIKEIRTDMGSKAQMNRLLQGDVGSGKTIVALLTMLIALDNSYQATLVAPTEILAQQHYSSLSSLLDPLDINVELLTGSTPRAARRIIHEDLESGKLHVLIGTHAVFEPTVIFNNLGLAIIDEQHKFGVAQRAKLWKKNTIPPHVLVMTATPIPRTLAMTMYGDLDLSIIDELPPGRKPITTAHRTDRNRLAVQRFIKDEIKKGRQVYIVYPLIEESQSMDYKDLMDGYESMVRDFPQPDYQVSIVHGKMKPEAKAYEMKRFVEGHTHIMVATTVIEVGVNVPNASVMIVESAERFGLSQLHQLRGRVGRGADKSYCVLMTKEKLSTDANTRINAMVGTQDGFELAEVDLKLRGPGNLMGTQQSGVLQMIIADLSKDQPILESARKAALSLLHKDPNINSEVNSAITSTLLQLESGKGIWKYIS
ncbi:MAG: ATP-dependent DNA helicase RecG [Flavobacteriaceae bacterium]|jgi:ATP-dependent DNA helicase RecG|nr:ATP-dependent DNA helicase RecG [Flavobacteriaceae bacterium]